MAEVMKKLESMSADIKRITDEGLELTEAIDLYQRLREQASDRMRLAWKGRFETDLTEIFESRRRKLVERLTVSIEATKLLAPNELEKRVNDSFKALHQFNILDESEIGLLFVCDIVKQFTCKSLNAIILGIHSNYSGCQP